MNARARLTGWVAFAAMLAGSLAHAQESRSAASGVTEPVLAEIQQIERKAVAVAEDFPETLYNTYSVKGNKDKDTVGTVLLEIADFNTTSAFQISTKEQQSAITAAGRTPDDRNFVYVSKPDTVKKVKESFAAVRKAIHDNPDLNNLEDWLFVISFSCERYGRLAAYYQENGLTQPHP